MTERAAYIFVKRADPENPKHSHERVHRIYDHDINLSNILEAVEDFLRGCGFNFEMGSLQIVEKE